MLQKIKKFFIYPFLDIYTLLKSNKTESILSVWFMACILIMLTIYLSNNYSLNLNLVGDAMGGIFGSLISTIVLIFVIESYKLQKKELVDTRIVLEGQENTMIEQRFQETFALLLRTAQDHFNNLKISIEEQKRDDNLYNNSFIKIQSIDAKPYFELSGGAAVIYLLNVSDLSKYSESGTLGNFKKYINTLGILENLIEINERKIDKDFYIKLAKTQINEVEKRLFHNLKYSFKKMELYNLKHLMNYNDA